MRKFLSLFVALISFATISNAQCDPTFTSTNIDCDSVWFVPASTGPQYVYFWDFGDGQTSMETSPAHTYSTNSTFTVILTIQDTVAGCFQSNTDLVTVNCASSCFLLTDFAYTTANCEVFFIGTASNGTPPYSYFWDFGDGNTATGPNPSHPYANNATYNTCLTVSDANGCDTTICNPVVQQCTPQSCDAQFTYSFASCDSIYFYPSNLGSQYIYNWDFGNGSTSTQANPLAYYPTNGTYVISCSVLDTVTQCQDTYNYSIQVNCNPCTVQGAFAHYVDSINCSVNFVSTAFGGSAPYTYFWQFGDGQTSNSAHPTHTYPTQGTYTPLLTITDANGCDTTIYDVVQAYCSPTSCDAQFTYNFVDCDSVYFYPASSGLNYSYSWDFGDGATSSNSNPTHTYSDGVYQVSLYLEDTLSGCSDSTVMWLTINCGSPCSTFADFTYQQNFNNCEFTFVSSAYGGLAPYTYLWDFGDGNTSTEANPTHTFPNNQTYQPCLTVTDASGCDTTICQAIFPNCTYQPCDAQFTWSLIGCDSVMFYPVAYGPQFTYDWNFGDGGTSTDQYPVHAFAANGLYTIQLTISDSINNCTDNSIQQLTINCNITNCNVLGDFTTYTDSVNCGTQFISTAYGGTAPYSYFWSFGDGQTSTQAHPLHVYPNYSTYTPCLTITDANGCDTTICQVVQTNCNTVSCDAQFTASYLNCNTLQFYSGSTGLNFDYFWDFGDGNTSTEATPTHTFADGVHVVYLYVTDSLAGCFDQSYYTLQVNCGGCTVDGAFTYNQNPNNCETFFVPAPYGGQAPYSYLWDFGDGNTSNAETPTHVYPNGQSFTPCLTITDANGCDTTICQSLFSNCFVQPCNAQFTWTLIGCDSVIFSPVLTGSQYAYDWSFGDGGTSSAQNPVHSYSANGAYTVQLVIIDSINNCGDQTFQSIDINCAIGNCNVLGDFTSYVDSVDCSTQFISTAYNGTAPYSYFWNFGDGQTSTDPHPVHTYPNYSTYTPCLTITDASGCDTTICYAVQTNCVTTSCDAQFTYTYLSCNSIQFISASSGLNFDYFWDFGDGNTSTEASPTHTFADGVHVVYLYINDSLAGCFDQWYYTLQVNCGGCTVNGAFTTTQNYNNCEMTFYPAPYGGQAPYSYLWDFGDGNTSSLENPTHAYPNGSTWTPCLTITDANGCDTTICDVVYSQCSPPQCDPSFTWTNIGCDSLYFFPVASGPGMTYDWNFGDGTFSTEQNPTHTFANGVHTVYLAITDTLFNCFNQTAYQITINCGFTPCNVQGAFSSYTDSLNCSTQFISTAFAGTAPYSYYWDFGDGNTSTEAHPVHSYPNFTTWTPCLTITDANGCDTTICDVVYSQCDPTSCDAQFTYSYQDCQTVVYYAGAQGSQYSYYWDLGDGNTSTDDYFGHTYSNDGTYYVVLTVMDTLSGCQDVFTVPVTVACGNVCNVNGDFQYTMNFNNCEVAYYAQAFGGQAPYSYFWNFGDGNTSNSMNPVHQYPGGAQAYDACLTVTDANGCDTTICQWVTTNCPDPACVATFNQSFIACDSVWFIPSLNDPNFDYFWDFGDGNTSTMIDPTHTYSANGTYVVVLTVSNTNSGCSDSFTQVMTVNCNASPCNIQGLFQWYSDSTQCEINFVSTAWGGTAPYSYFWSFGDGGTSGIANPVHTFAPGTWTPCLTITDANGCDTTYCDVVYSQCTNSIEEDELADFKIYPNPSNGLFFIELDIEADILIYDLSGKLVHGQSNESANEQIKVDLGHLESGTYLVTIISDKKFEPKRIIKH